VYALPEGPVLCGACVPAEQGGECLYARDQGMTTSEAGPKIAHTLQALHREAASFPSMVFSI
jgi:hypothetical protein